MLLLENDPGLARALSLMLRQSGCGVESCALESETMERLSARRLLDDEIDMVLVDLAGGRPGAEEFLAGLRSAAELLPVIVIAPYGQELCHARLGDHPSCHILTSPLDPEELRHCLALAEAKMRRDAKHQTAFTAKSQQGGKPCASKN